jgi:hypothetical protein
MLFSDPVLFEIPVLPRIKKFIAVKLRDADGRPHPLLVSPSTEGASLMLWAMAQSEKVRLVAGWRRPSYAPYAKFPQGLRDGSGRIIAPEDMTEQLGMGIRGFHKTRHQYLFNYAELVTFSNFVDYLMFNELACHCLDTPDLSIMAHVKLFTDYYDLSEEDLPEKAFKQKLWRSQNATLHINFNTDVGLTKIHHFQPVSYAVAA